MKQGMCFFRNFAACFCRQEPERGLVLGNWTFTTVGVGSGFLHSQTIAQIGGGG